MTRFFISRPVPSNASLIMLLFEVYLPAAALFLCATVSQLRRQRIAQRPSPGSGAQYRFGGDERAHLGSRRSKEALRQNHSLRGCGQRGVWKSDDGGTRYRPVFDEQPVHVDCAIALDPKNSKNVWSAAANPGHATASRSETGSTITDGARAGPCRPRELRAGCEDHSKSKKAATRFTRPCRAHCGATPTIVGLYKTEDGGKTWKKILKGTNLSTGCTSIASIRPSGRDARVHVGFSPQRLGIPFGRESPTAPSASGLFRSTDGGNSWMRLRLSPTKGFPKKPYGRLAWRRAFKCKARLLFRRIARSALFVSAMAARRGTT